MIKRETRWDAKIALDWKFAHPPSRPSLSETGIFEEHFARLIPKQSSVLILGSTPEFRNVAFKYRIDTVHVADYNRDTYEILSHECGEAPRSEQLILRDWRNLDSDSECKYDLVVGDLVLNVLPPVDHAEMLQRIAGLLKPTGRFVHREWVQMPESLFKSVADLVHAESAGLAGAALYAACCLPLINFYLDRATNEVNVQVILDGLRAAQHAGEIGPDVLQTFDAPWGHYRTPNWILSERSVLELLREHFAADAGAFGTDSFAKYCPIFVCGPAASERPRG